MIRLPRSRVVPIETIAVVGSGIMGRGIAYAAARGGFRTILHDVKYRPAPLLVQHVKAGRLGQKAGRGVYDYGGPS
jgi:3-hydroxyacyl-CoA dehydrogenase